MASSQTPEEKTNFDETVHSDSVPKTEQRPTPGQAQQNTPPPTAPAYTSPIPMPQYHRYRSRQSYYQRAAAQNSWIWVLVAAGLLMMTLILTMGLIFVLRTAEDDDAQSVAAQSEATENANATQAPIIIGDASTGGASNNENPDSGTENTNTANADNGATNNATGGDPDGNAGTNTDENPTPEPLSLNIEAWDGEDRFTILLMGIDARPSQGANGLYRTDTMMVISLDPNANRIGIMSIPRDTYVEIPGYNSLQRVNTAYMLGNLQEPGYGPQLAMQTIQYNFGIRINEYMLVDFNAFISVIDEIGGIDVYVEREINDRTYPDMNYGYEPFYISAGQHHLDGATALKYARSRHTSDDIDRGRRQQQILLAIRERILSLNMVDDLLRNALSIWNDIDEGVETGLEFEQILQLALFASEIPSENIYNGVVNWECCLTSYTTPNGASVLIPNRYALGSFMVDIFGEGYNQ